MILGGGDIASVLPKRDDLLFFASGVSNSQETRHHAYKREEDLLCAQPQDAHIVYFSSLAIFYSDTRYTRHKRLMELLIKELFPTYTIIRIGNITFGTNPNTIINFFKKELAEGRLPELRDEPRYLVDRAEFLHWISLIPKFSCEMNIPGWMVSVPEIWEMVEKGEL